jgi:hypothetical protein
MWANLKDKPPSPPAPPATSSTAAAVAAAEDSAAALEREMEDAEDLFGDDAPAPVAAPAPAPAAPAEPAVATLARTQRATSEKESQVKASLDAQREKVAAEARRLAVFETELKKLKVKEAEDVGVLRSKLEECQRDLAWLERDFKTKEAAYVKAKDAREAALAKKRTMHEQLALLVLSSEKRKEEKLNELIDRMNEKPGDGPTDEQLLG